jgi:hypothetical protein
MPSFWNTVLCSEWTKLRNPAAIVCEKEEVWNSVHLLRENSLMLEECREMWHHIPQDGILHSHCCENLKSYTVWCLSISHTKQQDDKTPASHLRLVNTSLWNAMHCTQLTVCFALPPHEWYLNYMNSSCIFFKMKVNTTVWCRIFF